MRLSKFLIIVFFITSVSLLYVYQQTEIFRLAYTGGKQQAAFQDLLDKNNILRYNIKSKASLVNIGGRISGCTDFQMPDSYRLVRLPAASVAVSSRNAPAQTENVFSRLFGIKREAEARTINP